MNLGSWINICAVVILSSVLAQDSQSQDTQPCTANSEGFPIPAFLRWVLIILLVCMSALFSGLTLGLCGLDKLSLQVVVESGTPDEKRWANKILPIRQDGNLLLCTLLLGNVAVNSALSILMADVAGGTVGFLVSTGVIVIFGEIVPQALCSRHPLPIGAASAPVVRLIIFIFYPIAKPVAWTLDRILGMEIATKFSKQELSKLLDIQKTTHNVLTADESRILQGALNFKEKRVFQVMTKIDRIVTLNIEEKFDFSVLFRIFKTGHSRIPVYEGEPSNIIGLIFVKDLILVNPEDEVPVRTIMECHGRSVHTVYDDSSLDTMLQMFSSWRQHLAVVMAVDETADSDPKPHVVGIVTLEDVIEELIAQELVDETDNFVSNESRDIVNKPEGMYSLLSMFDTRIHSGAAALSNDESLAIHRFLDSAFPELFGLGCLSAAQLAELLANSKVIDVVDSDDQPAKPVITRGNEIDFAVLVLQGKVEIIHSTERFTSRVGPFTLMCSSVLTSDPPFIPDFSAVPVSSLRYLAIEREQYKRMCEQTQQQQTTTPVSIEEEDSDLRILHTNVKSTARKAKLFSKPTHSHSKDAEKSTPLRSHVALDMFSDDVGL